MNSMRTLLLPTAAVWLLVFGACGPTHTGVKLRDYEQTYDPDAPERNRASFDLQCPAEQTKLKAIDSMSFGARGCGRQIRYMKRCRRCQWEPAGGVTQVVSN
jgi:hypothetical protein